GAVSPRIANQLHDDAVGRKHEPPAPRRAASPAHCRVNHGKPAFPDGTSGRPIGRSPRYLQEVVTMTAATTAHRRATPSLHSLVDAAYHADPADRLIAPVGDNSYSTLFNLIPATLAVLREAAGVEPDPRSMKHWYRHVP